MRALNGPQSAFVDGPGQRSGNPVDRLFMMPALLKLAAQGAAVHKLLIEVQNLLKPRSAYRDPELIRRIKATMAEA